MKANGNFSDANLERLHSFSISCVMSPSVAADLECPLSVGMRVSVLQPFWIAMIIFCWKVKLLKLPSVTLTHVCGTNSHNRRAKGQPGVGVVKIFCDSDSTALVITKVFFQFSMFKSMNAKTVDLFCYSLQRYIPGPSFLQHDAPSFSLHVYKPIGFCTGVVHLKSGKHLCQLRRWILKSFRCCWEFSRCAFLLKFAVVQCPCNYHPIQEDL